MSNSNSNTHADSSRADLERGLRFAHVMMTVGQEQGNEAVAYVQAIADLLIEKGVIQADELEAPLERARQEVEHVMMPRVRLAAMGDKYGGGQNVDIDRASRIPLCRAR